MSPVGFGLMTPPQNMYYSRNQAHLFIVKGVAGHG